MGEGLLSGSEASPTFSTWGSLVIDKKTKGFALGGVFFPRRFSPPPIRGYNMKLIEEIYVKADKDTICQTCGIDILEGSNHLLETYVHQGALLTSHYCLNKKCNPPNNVRSRLFVGFGLLIFTGAIALEVFIL